MKEVSSKPLFKTGGKDVSAEPVVEMDILMESPVSTVIELATQLASESIEAANPSNFLNKIRQPPAAGSMERL